MLDMVARPVLNPPDAAHVIVREHPGPHDIGARLVVMWILDDTRRLMDHRL